MWWQREKNPNWELNPGHPSHSLVIIMTELSRHGIVNKEFNFQYSLLLGGEQDEQVL
jgi:hypothetical protein